MLDGDGPAPEPLVRAISEPRGVRASLQEALPLLMLDGVAVSAAWLLVATRSGVRFSYAGRWFGATLPVLGVVVLVLVGNYVRRLYAEAKADRALELVGCARSCFVAGIVFVVAGEGLRLGPSPWRASTATVLGLVLMIIARSAYRARVTAQRRANEAVRPAIVVGTNDEAFELCRLLDQDSAFGFRPWGVVGDRAQYDRYPFEPPWLGDVESVSSAVKDFGIDHVFVARTAISAAAFAALTRTLTGSGVHVAASSGLPSIDQRRLRIMPIAQMPVYCVSAAGPSRREAFLKRSIDVAVGSVSLLAALPVMVVTALAILVFDGRPILFRQQRVGRNGKPFTMFKFRTMVPDAELRIIDLLAANERQGPLFKLTRDPRVTRIGRFLRDSSLDELPQLVNVLLGKMSLVGPRPALLPEVESFSEELLARNGARPGMTGLWQVEAGDDPSFVLYEHLDLYYVENWSTALDLAILTATIPTVAWRTVERLVRARRQVRGEQPGPSLALPVPSVLDSLPVEVVEDLLTPVGTPFGSPVGTPAQPIVVPELAYVAPRGSFRHDVAVISTNGRAVALGLAFARGGLSVVLHDSNVEAVELVNAGKMPVRGGAERNLLRRTVREGRIWATSDVGVVSGAECVVLALGAAERAWGQVESTLRQAVESIRAGLRDGQLLVLENSLDPVVAQQVEALVAGFGRRVDVALCRERIPSGVALAEFSSAPQILCGSTPIALQRVQRLFQARTVHLPEMSEDVPGFAPVPAGAPMPGTRQ